MRTWAEIEEEIRTLRALRNRGECRSNTRQFIDAQIKVLEEKMSNDDIYDLWDEDTGEEPNFELLDYGLEAKRWRDDGGDPPSTDWASVIGFVG